MTDEDIDRIFYPDKNDLKGLHSERANDWNGFEVGEPSPEAVREAIKQAEAHTDGFYIANTVRLIAKDLTKMQLLHLLLVVELGKDFRRLLPFADWVEILFTEDGELGEAMYLHLYTKLALRGFVSVKLGMW